MIIMTTGIFFLRLILQLQIIKHGKDTILAIEEMEFLKRHIHGTSRILQNIF